MASFSDQTTDFPSSAMAVLVKAGVPAVKSMGIRSRSVFPGFSLSEHDTAASTAAAPHIIENIFFFITMNVLVVKIKIDGFRIVESVQGCLTAGAESYFWVHCSCFEIRAFVPARFILFHNTNVINYSKGIYSNESMVMEPFPAPPIPNWYWSPGWSLPACQISPPHHGMAWAGLSSG